jgi:hypothetical protein
MSLLSRLSKLSRYARVMSGRVSHEARTLGRWARYRLVCHWPWVLPSKGGPTIVGKLIGKNMIELIELPTGQPGHPPHATTKNRPRRYSKRRAVRKTGYVKVVKASKGRYGATHAATETGELACGTKPHANATITEVSREPKDATCRSCRSQLGIDETDNANLRLEALFVLAITLGLRPGELRKLTWDHVDLNRGVVHVWRSASKTGDTKTPKSKRSLTLPRRAITALKAHKARQVANGWKPAKPGTPTTSCSATRTATPTHPMR